jgi:hypothetical protein
VLAVSGATQGLRLDRVCDLVQPAIRVCEERVGCNGLASVESELADQSRNLVAQSILKFAEDMARIRVSLLGGRVCGELSRGSDKAGDGWHASSGVIVAEELF